MPLASLFLIIAQMIQIIQIVKTRLTKEDSKSAKHIIANVSIPCDLNDMEEDIRFKDYEVELKPRKDHVWKALQLCPGNVCVGVRQVCAFQVQGFTSSRSS